MAEEQKSRQYRWQKKKLQNGLCYKCGEPTSLNSKGKRRRLCDRHLQLDTQRKAA